ncbi:hypothetical protein LUZ63_007280 [Rhynchospora breviuscula]|uniref:Glycosyltransferase 61 catalytic domain-containing protein n=1 Tax=Rhynchospora breviuscula TaxID=2022672 RepID=A0A9Q0CRE4_9POAL|nr:hypothetical protein LUZ63_007280 [Rhynchospora breviuscula]
MGDQFKRATSVGEIITGFVISCFVVSLVYSYFSVSPGSFAAHRTSVFVDGGLNGQTSDMQGDDDHIISENIGEEHMKNKSSKATPMLLCDIGDRSDVCEIYSNVRIHGNSSSIFYTPDLTMDLGENKTWTMKPYTCKGDINVMEHVTAVTIKPLYASTEAPKCNIYHNITAIVFSKGIYAGINFFHDFSDVLIPLFITARQFKGEVQILMVDLQPIWIEKHKKFLDQISNYEIIDFNNENQVHCYPRVIVGLYSHGALIVDPSRTPSNDSMVDFARLIRRAYSLEREFATNLVDANKKRPRLLIIARNHTRKLINIDEVVAVGEEFGFEVAVNESSLHTNVEEFARMVNSFDVMVGVHGAGLTNEVFLPTNAVLVQIIPFGNIEWIGYTDYGLPALNMKLKYVQYCLSEEESTLTDLYPRDHAVFRDPESFHRKGWGAMAKVYLTQQNVKLNITRFKPVLTSALELLGDRNYVTWPDMSLCSNYGIRN